MNDEEAKKIELELLNRVEVARKERVALSRSNHRQEIMQLAEVIASVPIDHPRRVLLIAKIIDGATGYGDTFEE